VEEVRKIWTGWPDANIGVLTGSGVVVVDVDPDKGGAASLAALEREHSPLPIGPTVLTGGGGRHLYFAVHRPIRNSAGRLGSGLDIRAEGGFIVVPPSRHASGRRYRWAEGQSFFDLELPTMPDWMLARLTQTMSQMAHPPSFWQEIAANGFSEGQRNDGITRIAGHLLRHADPHLTLELVICFNAQKNNPPLGAEEVTRIVESVARSERARRGGRS